MREERTALWSSIAFVESTFHVRTLRRLQSRGAALALSISAGFPEPDCCRARELLSFCSCGAETSASPTPSANTPTGASMKLSISYKSVDSRESVEEESERHIGKLNRLLKS